MELERDAYKALTPFSAVDFKKEISPSQLSRTLPLSHSLVTRVVGWRRRSYRDSAVLFSERPSGCRGSIQLNLSFLYSLYLLVPKSVVATVNAPQLPPVASMIPEGGPSPP